jgi:hypothetical protein
MCLATADFGCCAKVIDGILIWIHKPSRKDRKDAGCSPGKFLCAGRKKECRLTCHAVCDARGRILDMPIKFA